uniref:Adherens junctions associated protein 1 n=1 Tax=Nothoprocta perdicaria TaxID=30464 RepID=A0A8C6Z7J3_NOTPE
MPSMSVRRSGCPAGSHAWILIAMFQLASDWAACEALAARQGDRLTQRPAPRHRLPAGPWWSARELRVAGPAWSQGPARAEGPRWRGRSGAAGGLRAAATRRPQPRAARARRQLRGGAFRQRDGRATAVPEVIVWGPTGEEDSVETSTLPARFGPATTASAWQTRAATQAAATTTSAPSTAAPPPQGPPPSPAGDTRGSHPGRGSTTEPDDGPGGNGKEARPPRILGDTSGLAVHQIITITVSLIMVIAALITTLVLKNCCVQSGNTRRNSHQRKINQQEESCQNLTDFTPARVPSSLDIFTAYNETLQCSHECVRTPVPLYTEEALHSPGAYKTAFNGNRPSSSDRHLIPVAFVSEKWFEISC